MCGRYALHASPEVVALQFGLDAVPGFKARYNICPGMEVLAVDNRRKAGFVPWNGRFANARAESVTRRPAFRVRCLLPASGFYEWQKIARTKRPWYVLPKDAGLFGLAGFIASSKVVLITTEPNPLLATIHDRMPVIIPPARYEDWLAGADGLLQPYPADAMHAHPVHPRVNTPANDDPGLISEFDAQPVLDILPVHGRTHR